MRVVSVVGAALAAALFTPVEAMPIQPDFSVLSPTSSFVTPVAQGCGPGWWRGPWGHCRHTPYYGPLPGGGYAAYYGYYGADGCPPGWWRGPWGHCRNTPYHGPLPGGGYQ